MAVFFRQKALTVTPNERQALALWEEDAERRQEAGEDAWETLPVCSWTEFLRALWDEYWLAGQFDSPPPTLMTDWQERFLWMKILRESVAGGELLNLPAASQLAGQAWQLTNSYLIEDELWSEAHYWPEDTQVFLLWARDFKNTCRHHNWLEPSRLERSLVDRIRAGKLPLKALPKQILFSGFAEWTPAQRLLLDALSEWGVSITEDCPNTQTEGQGWSLRPATDPEAEVREAAHWLRQKLESGEGKIRVGLVVPDLAARRNEISRILSEVFQPSQLLLSASPENVAHDLSAGLPLSRWPVVQDAIALLRLHRRRHTLEEWKALFMSPFLGDAEWEASSRALLWNQLCRDGLFHVDRTRLEKMCQKTEEQRQSYRCPKLLKRLRKVGELLKKAPPEQMPSDWSELFSELLDAYGWPGERALNSAEYQTVSRWKKALSQLGSLDLLLGKVDYQTAFAALSRIAEETTYQPKVSHGQIEVMGTLEAVGLHFDHLWLAGFHDGVWPVAARPNPYLPFNLQKKHGLAHSTPDRELQFARIISKQLIAASHSGVVSYPQFSAEHACRPSPLFDHLPPADIEDSETVRLARLWLESQELEQFQDPGPPQVAELAESRGGTGIFKHQAACPFRAFAYLRLNARPLEGVKEGLDPRERGNLLHLALEHLWKTITTLKSWSNLSSAEQQRSVEVCAQLAVDELRKQRPDVLRGMMTKLEVDRVKNIVLEWMSLETVRQPFEVVSTEERVQLEFAGLNFQATIDRIDRLADGSLAVIDYKTGKATPKDWLGERPKEPQLPLYCVANPRPVDAVCFARIRVGDMSFKGMSREDEVLPGVEASEFAGDGLKKWEERLVEWNQVLSDLAEEFRSGRAVVDPHEGTKTCRNCGLEPLCRIDERGLQS